MKAKIFNECSVKGMYIYEMLGIYNWMPWIE